MRKDVLIKAREAFSHWWETIHGNTILVIIALFSVVVPLVIYLGSLNERDFEYLKVGKKTLTCLNFETGERYVMDSTKIDTPMDLRLLRRSDSGCFISKTFYITDEDKR